MNILITGASGFIGYALAKKLSSSRNKIYITDNFYRGKYDKHLKELILKKNVYFFKADLTKKNNFKKFPKKIDIIFHLAAINGTKNFYNIPDKVLTVNTLININLLEYLKNNPKIKTIFASSSEVYASTTDLLKNKIPSKENIEISIKDISNIRYSYAISKIFGENAFYSYSKNYNIKFNIIRFHNIYGPRMGIDHVIPELFFRIQDCINKKINKVSLFGSSNTRSFCYIDDAVNALLIVSKKFTNEIIHIGNDKEEIQIFNLCKKILGYMNKDLAIEKKSAPSGSVARRLPDLKKLYSYGYKPKVKLDHGIKKTLDWYIKNT